MRRFYTIAAMAMLLAVLGSCAGPSGSGEQPPVSSSAVTSTPISATDSLSSEEAPNLLPSVWSDQDVVELLEQYGAQLIEIWESGGVTLVRYRLEGESLESVALADYRAGRLLPLTNTLMPGIQVSTQEDAWSTGIFILHPGSNIYTSHQLWPTVEQLWLPQSPLELPHSDKEPYLMSQERSFSIGNHYGARVERVTMTDDMIYFEFLDNGGLFVGGDPITPVTQVSFQGDVCTVFFPDSILDPEFQAVLSDVHDSADSISLLSAEDTEAGAELKFSCGDLFQRDDGERETRWYIQESADPVTWLPRAAICFKPHWSGNYPEGW